MSEIRRFTPDEVLEQVAFDRNLTLASKFMRTMIGEGFDKKNWQTLRSRAIRRMETLQEMSGLPLSVMAGIVVRHAEDQLDEVRIRHPEIMTEPEPPQGNHRAHRMGNFVPVISDARSVNRTMLYPKPL